MPAVQIGLTGNPSQSYIVLEQKKEYDIRWTNKKSVSGYPFHNEETSMHPHSKIIRQDSETFIVEDENTIYEIDKHCAARHGYLPQQRN